MQHHGLIYPDAGLGNDECQSWSLPSLDPGRYLFSAVLTFQSGLTLLSIAAEVRIDIENAFRNPSSGVGEMVGRHQSRVAALTPKWSLGALGGVFRCGAEMQTASRGTTV
jgi:hypothetical protein